MTGQGGWPLNAFLTPEQTPFYVGTYFPPSRGHGMPSWRDGPGGGGRGMGAARRDKVASRALRCSRVARCGRARLRALGGAAATRCSTMRSPG